MKPPKQFPLAISWAGIGPALFLLFQIPITPSALAHLLLEACQAETTGS